MFFLPLSIWRRTLPALLLVALSASCASASIVTFFGEDLGATSSGAHPNASAAAASFAAAASAVGSNSVFTFESLPAGPIAPFPYSTNAQLAPNLFVSGQSAGGFQYIRNQNLPGFGQYNTTPGGSNYLEVAGGTVEFDLRNSHFFGAYVSNVHSTFTDFLGRSVFYQDTISVRWSDGTSQTYNLPATGTTDQTTAVDFVGFLNSSAYIESVTFNAGSFDLTGTGQNTVNFPAIDDVQYQSGPLAVAATPEPESFFLAATGMLGVLGAVRLRLTIRR